MEHIKDRIQQWNGSPYSIDTDSVASLAETDINIRQCLHAYGLADHSARISHFVAVFNTLSELQQDLIKSRQTEAANRIKKHIDMLLVAAQRLAAMALANQGNYVNNCSDLETLGNVNDNEFKLTTLLTPLLARTELQNYNFLRVVFAIMSSLDEKFASERYQSLREASRSLMNRLSNFRPTDGERIYSEYCVLLDAIRVTWSVMLSRGPGTVSDAAFAEDLEPFNPFIDAPFLLMSHKTKLLRSVLRSLCDEESIEKANKLRALQMVIGLASIAMDIYKGDFGAVVDHALTLVAPFNQSRATATSESFKNLVTLEFLYPKMISKNPLQFSDFKRRLQNKCQKPKDEALPYGIFELILRIVLTRQATLDVRKQCLNFMKELYVDHKNWHYDRSFSITSGAGDGDDDLREYICYALHAVAEEKERPFHEDLVKMSKTILAELIKQFPKLDSFRDANKSAREIIRKCGEYRGLDAKKRNVVNALQMWSKKTEAYSNKSDSTLMKLYLAELERNAPGKLEVQPLEASKEIFSTLEIISSKEIISVAEAQNYITEAVSQSPPPYPGVGSSPSVSGPAQKVCVPKLTSRLCEEI